MRLQHCEKDNGLAGIYPTGRFSLFLVVKFVNLWLKGAKVSGSLLLVLGAAFFLWLSFLGVEFVGLRAS